ncbi:MAG TPA: alpha-galactosidase [Armatimonadota bacterium]|nr:alpha-galactosidase [Armatimonadota bacterium]
MGSVNAAMILRDPASAAALGLEMLHIDAGWFRGVGDWRPDPVKFPHGLAAAADYAHAKGLKFGLWVGWTQGGIDADAADRQVILNVFAPDRRDWFTHDYPPDWKPAAFTGADLCLSDPAADNWLLSMLDRLVKEYHLDMLEHDQRMIVDSCSRTDHPHTASPGGHRLLRRPRLLRGL